jgi:3-hydroxymyristoyl/3-hydroxydecanoyl-(acyl carrier protein) dehydratase
MKAQTLSYEGLKEILPYRYPMLLLDRIQIESETHAVGLKNLSFNDMVFQGHFPGHPIMPGVMQVETMQQVAVVLLQDKFDPTGTKDIYIKRIKKVKFRKPALPGDRMLIDVKIDSINDDEAEITAANRTNSGVTCQVNMTISVRERVYDLPVISEFSDIDKNEDSVMDAVGIMDIIPHRYPFMLVDYISSIEGNDIIAVKNITGTEPFMHSYSPDYSVLPGAIQMEIIAQAGCAHTLLRPENKGKLAYFMSISDVECYAPVRPGDQLKIEVELPSSGSRFGKGTGFLYVEEKLVSKGAIAFALVDE